MESQKNPPAGFGVIRHDAGMIAWGSDAGVELAVNGVGKGVG